jgi:penicillin-insensitive murein endopeptidase
MVREIPEYRSHRVAKGETLGKLAKRYGTTVPAIQRANGLRSSLIQAKKTYRIPVPAGQSRATAPLEFPPRRLPPEPEADAGNGSRNAPNSG